MKIRVNVSLSQDTSERLKQIAFEHHTTVSQLITDFAWDTKVTNEQIRGQERLNLKK